MLIAYRPELENPPREGGFGIITDGGMIQLAPGLNQGVPEDQWKKARDNSTVKRMMTIGAIEEVREQPTVETIPHDVQTLAICPSLKLPAPLNSFMIQINWHHGRKSKGA
jgi:hypothetical protein